MLVLSCEAAQQIRIGSDAVVSVLEVDGRQVRLGIDAPRELPVALEQGSAPR